MQTRGSSCAYTCVYCARLEVGQGHGAPLYRFSENPGMLHSYVCYISLRLISPVFRLLINTCMHAPLTMIDIVHTIRMYICVVKIVDIYMCI